jgi:hypothetical protein
MQNRSLASASRSGNPGGASRVRHRALLGTAVLAVLLALAGLAAYLTRAHPAAAKAPGPLSSSSDPSAAAPSPPSASPLPRGKGSLPVPPSTGDPVAYAKAAAAALWSYDTRAYTQPQLLTALGRWLTAESQYADAASVDTLIPSAQVWREMAQQGQFATATVSGAYFPQSFTQALQADPGAITTAYIYAVTVTGNQTIAWNGAPKGGEQGMSMTLAVQCRPSHSCALAGVLPAVAP